LADAAASSRTTLLATCEDDTAVSRPAAAATHTDGDGGAAVATTGVSDPAADEIHASEKRLEGDATRCAASVNMHVAVVTASHAIHACDAALSLVLPPPPAAAPAAAAAVHTSCESGAMLPGECAAHDDTAKDDGSEPITTPSGGGKKRNAAAYGTHTDDSPGHTRAATQ
jgi:hypothetical protein